MLAIPIWYNEDIIVVLLKTTAICFFVKMFPA